MRMKVGLTFACMNMKKLAMMLDRKGLLGPNSPNIHHELIRKINEFMKKTGLRAYLKPVLSSL